MFTSESLEVRPPDELEDQDTGGSVRVLWGQGPQPGHRTGHPGFTGIVGKSFLRVVEWEIMRDGCVDEGRTDGRMNGGTDGRTS